MRFSKIPHKSNIGSPTMSEKKKAGEDMTESIKAALLISGADKK